MSSRCSAAPPPTSTPNPTVEVLFAAALSLHQQGRTADAVRFYERILTLDPRHADSLHLLGMAAWEAHQPAVAVDLIGRALAVREAAPFYTNLGTILQAAGQLDEAANCYERALELEPGLAEAHLNLGLAHQLRGRLDDAAAAYERARDLKPQLAETWSNLGYVRKAQGRLKEAEEHLRAALERKPEFAEAHYNLGTLLMETERLEEAETELRAALRLKPTLAEAYANLGNLLTGQKRLEEAEASHRLALALGPETADGHFNLGKVLAERGKTAEAAAENEAALRLDPGMMRARNNLGNLYRMLERHHEAVAELKQIPKGDAEFSGAYNNMGLALMALGRHDEAVAAIRETLELEPEMAEAYCNLGAVEHARHHLDEAEALYRRSLELKPELPKPRLNLGLIQLQRGNWDEGWKNYASRWQDAPLHDRGFAQPEWHGEPLEGARILLHAEQGHGDTLQFLRYVPLVQAAGGVVVLEVQERMKRLAAALPDVREVVGQGERLPQFDRHCPLLSLPAVFKTTPETVPAQIPYLIVPDEARRKAAAIGWPGSGLRVGLVWAGNPSFRDDPYRYRTAPLELFQPLLEIEETHWYSLQIGEPAKELVRTASALTDLAWMTEDMADSAAQIERLDLVVSVDTSVAHLAGALGKPTWVLLPFSPDWRWLEGLADTPWYPRMRLFRQPEPGKWEPVIARLRDALAAQERSACHA